MATNPSRMTPVANIELDPIDTGNNEIPSEGKIGFENRLRENQRISPTSDINHHILSRKVNKNHENNFMEQMHKRIIKHAKHSKKLSSKITPRASGNEKSLVGSNKAKPKYY